MGQAPQVPHTIRDDDPLGVAVDHGFPGYPDIGVGHVGEDVAAAGGVDERLEDAFAAHR